MEKIFSFFKRRWWSFAPMIVCVCVFFLFWKLGAYEHRDNLLQTIGGLMLFFFPSTALILFVRKQIVKAWYPFALLYLVSGTIFLSSQDPYGWLISARAVYAAYLGTGLFVITLLWAIIHTLILRRAEKKAIQTAVK